MIASMWEILWRGGDLEGYMGKIGVSVEIEQLWLIRLEKVVFSLKYAPLFIFKITILLKNMFSHLDMI